MTAFFKQKGPGILLALAMACGAAWIGKRVPVIGGPVIGITLGILVSAVVDLPERALKGMKFTSKYILQAAIILLGFEMNVVRVIQVGQQSLAIILLTLTAAFLTAYLVGKRLRVHTQLATLIGVGTAICGGSAIAAAAPAIDADDQDVSFAISTIFLFNVVAVFLFPLAGHFLKMSSAGFGMWAGTAINDTSSVVAAGYSYSDAAGNFATIVKLTRSLAIVPVTLALALYTARNRNNTNGAFQFAQVFPWFVVGFLLAALANSQGWIPAALAAQLVQLGKFMIIMAMSAIGLNTKAQSFLKTGPRAILLGASTWFAVMLVSLAAQLLIQIW